MFDTVADLLALFGNFSFATLALQLEIGNFSSATAAKQLQLCKFGFATVAKLAGGWLAGPGDRLPGTGGTLGAGTQQRFFKKPGKKPFS